MSGKIRFKLGDKCMTHPDEAKVIGGKAVVTVEEGNVSIASLSVGTNTVSSNEINISSSTNKETIVTVKVDTDGASGHQKIKCTYINSNNNQESAFEEFDLEGSTTPPPPPPVEPSDIYWCRADGTKINDLTIDGGEFLPYIDNSGTVTKFETTQYFKVVNGTPAGTSNDLTRLSGNYSLVGNGVYKITLTCDIPVDTNKDVTYTISCDGKSIYWKAHLADKFVNCYVKMDLKITAHWDGAIKYYVEYTPVIYNNTGGIWEGKVSNPTHPDATYSFWVDKAAVMQAGAYDGSYTIGISPESYIEYRDKKYYVAMMPTDYPNSGHYWIEGHEIESLKVANGGPVENNNNIRIDIDPSVPMDMQSRCGCTYVDSHWDASAPVQIIYSFVDY